ncbi:MlaC/ttg2D family ABC transporter substrate-binding protein [Defluviimonas salinarum]|uniref:ABC transporter substrate-binding protein n=1 Tax=Defluviimonas salinarum TaxID=2992147 RepID=A0ABT3J8B8_9RHOB|nr:ABC transporter substrate-binding protein [Defluviimonas salinarum]MCW3783670.1 ABC transporter substrate-binding protein [Defluviimonas salinarum]
MASNISRRHLLATLPAGLALAHLPGVAGALTVGEARALVDRVVDEVNGVINSGKSESAMLRSFEAIFVRYADVRYIAQSALGPAGRRASKAQMAAYIKAFQGYMARKYGRRFREFIGGRIEVSDARPLKSFYEVRSVAHLRGQAPFRVDWHVFDKSGRDLFFNIIIEGVNMLAAERTEIGAMLDRRKGDIGALTADLTRAG